MAIFEDHSQSWADFISRINHDVKLVEFIKSNQDAMDLTRARNLLSVGPGTGEIDSGIIALLPHLQQYTALEPDVGHLKALQTKLSQFSQIKTEYFNDVLQNYEDPKESYDIIMMAHVAYYFSECFEDQIRRTLSWLTDHGKILLILDQNTIHKIIASKFDGGWASSGLITVEDIRERLTDMGLQYEEKEIHYTLDVSHPGKGYYDFISILTNRKATKAEVDMALEEIKHLFIPGTKNIKATQSMFVINKQ